MRFLFVLVLGTAAMLGQAVSPMFIIVIVDITASMHVCPGGVAGPPSTASGQSVGVAGKLQGATAFEIPSAIEPFPLDGVKGEDSIAIRSLGSRLFVEGPFTRERSAQRREWDRVFSHPPVDWLGPSPMWDALIDAAHSFPSPPGRRAIIFVTDGQASGNAHTAAEAEAALVDAGIRLGVVLEESVLTLRPLTTMAGAGIDPGKNLRRISDVTNGRLVVDKAIGDFDRPCFRRNPARSVTAILQWLQTEAK